MYKIAIFSLVLLGVLFNYVSADSVDLEVKVLSGSSNKESQIKSFYPEIIPIEPGNTITWANSDSVTHSITSGMPNHPEYSGKFFSTGKIAPSKSVTIRTDNLTNFAYYYFCEIHPWLTGKIVLATAPESQPETENPIITDKKRYTDGQEILVSGQVHTDFAKTPYQILVYEGSELVEVMDGKFDEQAKYTQSIEASELMGTKYTLKVVYGLPTQVGTTTFLLQTDDEIKIPSWIKNGARWWSNGEISDAEFIEAVEFLAKEKIITIHKTGSVEGVKSIPSWLRTSASWWADGLISDTEFAKGLQYLANSGIIQL